MLYVGCWILCVGGRVLSVWWFAFVGGWLVLLSVCCLFGIVCCLLRVECWLLVVGRWSFGDVC